MNKKSKITTESKNNGGKVVKAVLDHELSGLANSTGSWLFFQPVEPKGLDRYKNAK